MIKNLLHCSDVRHVHYHIIQYDENNFRILKNFNQLDSGWELIKEVLPLGEKKTDDEEIQRVSLSRTNKRIRELAKCNHFEYFGTLTINGYYNNRYELDDCQSRLKKLLRRIHDKNSDFKYLIITEKHKDGAFHFHGLFSGLELHTNSSGYLYNKDLSEFGFNSFSPIQDYNKCCNYICKYITKDCVKNSHNQIFMRSKGLAVASHEEIKDFNFKGTYNFENDFCAITDIDLTQEIDENTRNLLTAIIQSNPKYKNIFDKLLDITF